MEKDKAITVIADLPRYVSLVSRSLTPASQTIIPISQTVSLVSPSLPWSQTTQILLTSAGQGNKDTHVGFPGRVIFFAPSDPWPAWNFNFGARPTTGGLLIAGSGLSLIHI